MRLQTGCRLLRICFLIALMAVTARASAYSVAGVYPVQDFIIADGEATLSSITALQTGELSALNVEIAPVNYETHELKKWETRYYKYLQDASYTVSSLQAGTTIYTQAFEALRNLVDLHKAMKANPQGIFATAGMNNLYLTTAVKFVKVFRTIKKEVLGSGRKSMLNGADRCRLMWSVSEELDELNYELENLCYSIRAYNILDVWMKATLPYGIYDHKMIAVSCFSRWKSRSRTVR